MIQNNTAVVQGKGGVLLIDAGITGDEMVCLANADWKARVAEGLPPEVAEETPLDLFGLITGLSAETAQISWDGPKVRIIEHPAHAPGHAALLVEERRVRLEQHQ